MAQMSEAQRTVLHWMQHGFPGYCELMLQTGCKSYKAVDWVLDALERRGLIAYENGEPEVTEAGHAALRC